MSALNTGSVDLPIRAFVDTGHLGTVSQRDSLSMDRVLISHARHKDQLIAVLDQLVVEHLVFN